MATNKRKEAAALFELIDKSTLKVPKGSGSLKIPNWWSSKQNPPPAAGAALPANQNKNASDVGGKTLVSAPGILETTPKPRLFEPPPAHVPPANTPSIRPPSSSVPVHVSPSVKPSINAPPASPARDTTPISEDELTPGETAGHNGVQARAYGPQTRMLDRRQWKPQPGAFARLPGWVLLSGLAAVIVVVFSIILLAKRGNNTAIAQNSNTAGQSGSLPPVRGGSILPPPINGGTGTGVSHMQNANDLRSPEGGHVFAGGTVPRSPELYYVIICTTPSSTIAERNADLVAKNGIDVCIERTTQGSRKELWYMLVSVQGFPSTTAAQPLRDQIVRIGDLIEKNAWKTAYSKNGLQSQAVPR